MGPKYEFTGETWHYGDYILYRIRRLSDNKIGNEGIKLISLFMTPKLKILNLQNCKIDINGINFIFIKTNLNKSLEQLFLKGNDLQSNNLIMLKKCNIIPTLNYIDIIDND